MASRQLQDVDQIPDETKRVRELLDPDGSEHGWNLQRSHRCHLLNFSKVISLSLILETIIFNLK